MKIERENMEKGITTENLIKCLSFIKDAYKNLAENNCNTGRTIGKGVDFPVKLETNKELYEYHAYVIEAAISAVEEVQQYRKIGTVDKEKKGNDLISRDETEQLLKIYADEVGCRRGAYELANGILKAACFLSNNENVPTAYNVDRIVEWLETNSMYVDEEIEAVVMLDDAVEIVKSGGVE